jgi:hypothetical protein
VTRFVICAKSTWHPSIRREHELARMAAAEGHDVVFVERPRDLRALAADQRRAWAKGLRHPLVRKDDAVAVVTRSTLAPAHRGALAGYVDGFILRRVLAEAAAPVIVTTVPWEWPAASRCTWARRVFDCADDWARILPKRADRIRSLCRRIAVEADAIVCASDHLAGLFAPRTSSVVRNGTAAVLLATDLVSRPRTSTMVYAGTLSERFDAPLVEAVLTRLPDWRIDLYGPCQYAGRGSDPDTELSGLLARWPSRVAWHGTVERDRLAQRLDTGDVLVIPHRRRGAVDGDSMKFYDYAARGRPVTTTPSTDGLGATLPPHTHVAATPKAFAGAVEASTHEPAEFAVTRRRWAEENAWQARWEAWAKAVLG